jgi:hypothetical protein
MTFPTANVVTTNLETSTSDPSLARVDLLDAINKLNLIMTEINTAGGAVTLDGSGYIPTARIPATITNSGTITLSSGSGIVNVQDILRLTQLPVASIITLTGNVAGDMAFCSNVGNVASNPGIAFYNGTRWRTLAFSANTFANI